MNVLGIMGSPRIKGNTDLLLDEALRGAESAGAEVEKIIVIKQKIAGCHECLDCEKDGNCVIRDNMDDIYPKLLDYDRIILASPIFFYGLPGQMKSFVDRIQAIWVRKYVLEQELPKQSRKGAFIGVGATKGEKLFDGSILTVQYFLEAIDVKLAEKLLVRDVDKKGDINDHPTILKDAFELGRRLSQE